MMMMLIVKNEKETERDEMSIMSFVCLKCLRYHLVFCYVIQS